MSGSATGNQAVEAAQNAVTAVYASELGRQPDAGGLATYTGLLLAGAPLSQVQSDIAQSPEAQADIQGIYRGVLNRPADPGGLAVDTQALSAGATLAQLRSGVANSPEAAQVIAGAFQAYLGRAPSAPEVAVYTSALAGGISYPTIRSGIILSQESTQNIQNLYGQYLGRPASAAEVQDVQRSLFGGGTLDATRRGLDAQHRLQISTVPEQTAALTTAYEDVFGHAPIDAPDSNASTIPTLQAELSLGRPIAEVEQVIDYRAASNNGNTDTYGYAVPAQYSPNGFSMFLIQASSTLSPATTNVSSAAPIPVTGGSGATGPDTITLTLAQLNTAPLTFSASLDGQSLGQATLAASSSFGTPSTGQVSFTGDFRAGRELDLSFGTIPLHSLYVVSGTLNGQSFLLDGAVNGTGGSIALFPHASSSGVVPTYSYPY